MQKILLINPPVRSDEAFARGSKSTASLIPPLGLAYIASCLKRQGHICEIYDGVATPIDIEELCKKAHCFPEQFVCACTLTLAKEVAAAIIKGADTPEKITAMTGVRSGCSIYCMAPILRMLKAHGVEIEAPPDNRWYNLSLSLWDVSDNVANKYPGYYLQEDKKEFHG